MKYKIPFIIAISLVLTISPAFAIEVKEIETNCDLTNCYTLLDISNIKPTEITYKDNLGDFITKKEAFSIDKTMTKPIQNTIKIEKIEWLKNITIVNITGVINAGTSNYWGIKDIWNSTWWNSSYPFRYPIIANTTDVLLIPINDTNEVKGNVIWVLQHNDSYLYSTETGLSGNVAIANETDLKQWENETTDPTNEGYDIANMFLNYGLVAVYHLNGIDDSTGVFDGEYMGSATETETNCLFGNCSIFQGSADYINVTKDPLLCPEVLSVEVWFNASSWEAFGTIVEYAGTSETKGWIIYYTTGNGLLHFVIGDGSDFQETNSPFVLTTNTFYHAVGTYNGTHAKLYVNGTGGTPTAQSTPVDPQTELRIGTGRYLGATEDFVGTIDEVRVYNRTLTDSEILNHYYTGINNYSYVGGVEEYVSPFQPITDNTIICFKTQPVCINLKDSSLIYKGKGYYE